MTNTQKDRKRKILKKRISYIYSQSKRLGDDFLNSQLVQDHINNLAKKYPQFIKFKTKKRKHFILKLKDGTIAKMTQYQ